MSVMGQHSLTLLKTWQPTSQKKGCTKAQQNNGPEWVSPNQMNPLNLDLDVRDWERQRCERDPVPEKSSYWFWRWMAPCVNNPRVALRSWEHPRLTNSKKNMGTSVLQPQELNSTDNQWAWKEDLEPQMRSNSGYPWSQPCEILNRQSSHAAPTLLTYRNPEIVNGHCSKSPSLWCFVTEP